MASHPQRSLGDTNSVPDVAKLGPVRPPLVLSGVDSFRPTAPLHLAAAAGSASGRCAGRGGRGPLGCRLVRHGGSHVSRREHTRARQSVDRHHRKDRALPLQPEPNLCGVLGSLGRHRSLSGELWLLITLVPAVALMSFWVIPREERYLEAQFFFEYLSYKSSVRRWFWVARWRLSEDEIDRLRRRGLRQTSHVLGRKGADQCFPKFTRLHYVW